jgi:hypothetical protein
MQNATQIASQLRYEILPLVINTVIAVTITASVYSLCLAYTFLT